MFNPIKISEGVAIEGLPNHFWGALKSPKYADNIVQQKTDLMGRAKHSHYITTRQFCRVEIKAATITVADYVSDRDIERGKTGGAETRYQYDNKSIVLMQEVITLHRFLFENGQYVNMHSMSFSKYPDTLKYFDFDVIIKNGIWDNALNPNIPELGAFELGHVCRRYGQTFTHERLGKYVYLIDELVPTENFDYVSIEGVITTYVVATSPAQKSVPMVAPVHEPEIEHIPNPTKPSLDWGVTKWGGVFKYTDAANFNTCVEFFETEREARFRARDLQPSF